MQQVDYNVVSGQPGRRKGHALAILGRVSLHSPPEAILQLLQVGSSGSVLSTGEETLHRHC